MAYQKTTDLDIPVLGIAGSKSKKLVTEVLAGVSNIHPEDTESTRDLVMTVNETGRELRLRFPLPKDGVSIAGTEIRTIDKKNYLYVIFDDGSETCAGEMPKAESGGGGSAVLTEKLISNVAMGQVKNGTTYKAGTSLETIVRDMLTSIVSPTVTMAFTPNKTVYDKVADTLSSLTFTVNATKGTNDIASVKIYIDEVEVKSFANVADGGPFSYTHNFSSATNKDKIALKVVVTDINGLSNQATGTINFVPKAYYGYVPASVATLTESNIKGLQNGTVKTTKGLKYTGITYPFGELNKIVYAYPKSQGALSKVMDEKNNFNYTDSFERQELIVDGYDYYAYIQKNASGADDNQLTFS